MMGLDLPFMALLMLLCGVVFVALLAGLMYLVARAVADRPPLGEGSARAVLDRRLAGGEISPEEYFERESALRSGAPVTRGRR